MSNWRERRRGAAGERPRRRAVRRRRGRGGTTGARGAGPRLRRGPDHRRALRRGLRANSRRSTAERERSAAATVVTAAAAVAGHGSATGDRRSRSGLLQSNMQQAHRCLRRDPRPAQRGRPPIPRRHPLVRRPRDAATRARRAPPARCRTGRSCERQTVAAQHDGLGGGRSPAVVSGVGQPHRSVAAGRRGDVQPRHGSIASTPARAGRSSSPSPSGRTRRRARTTGSSWSTVSPTSCSRSASWWCPRPTVRDDGAGTDGRSGALRRHRRR